MTKTEQLRQCLTSAGYVRVPVTEESTFVRVEFEGLFRRVPNDVVPGLCSLIEKAERKGGNVAWDALHDAFDSVLLPSTGRHRGLAIDGTFSKIEREIARVKLAIRQRNKDLDKLGVCVHVGRRTCIVCEKRDALWARQHRARGWLKILIAKNGEDAPYVDIGDGLA